MKKIISICSTITIALLLANCASTKVAESSSQRGIASSNNFTTCYEFDIDGGTYNNLYFYSEQNNSDIRKADGRCVPSRVRYVGPQNFEMMDGDIDAINEKLKVATSLKEELEPFFSGSEASSRKFVELSDGSKIVAARWNDGGKASQLIVVKPDFSTNSTDLLCQFPNHTQKIELREHKGKLMAFYRRPAKAGDNTKKLDSFGYYVGWKTCSNL